MILKKFFNKNCSIEDFIKKISNKDIKIEELNKCFKSINKTLNEIKNNNGDTLLFQILKKKNFRIAKWLIDNGATLENFNNENKSELDYLIFLNNERFILKLLKEKKINLNYKDYHENSLLQNIIINGNLTIAIQLIENGADLTYKDHQNRNILYDSLSYGNLKFTSFLIKRLTKEQINNVDNTDNTIMQHPQITDGNKELEKLLILNGVNTIYEPITNEIDYITNTKIKKKNHSYLYNISLKNNIDLVKLCLENGANPNITVKDKGNSLLTELLYSEINDNITIKQKQNIFKVCDLMIEFGGNINHQNVYKETILWEAIRKKDIEVIKYLFEKDINLNLLNNKNENVLFLLLKDGIKYIDIVDILIKKNINILVKNKNNKNVFEFLNYLSYIEDEIITVDIEIDEEPKYIKLIEYLLNNIKDKEIYSFLNEPIFFDVIRKGHLELFKVYLKKLNPNMKNNDNLNIFYVFVKEYFEKIDDNITKEELTFFKTILNTLPLQKINKNEKDDLGRNILNYVISTNCNEKLFKILINNVIFDFNDRDNNGRHIIHNCVLFNKINILERIHFMKKSLDLINKPDNYNMLPINYAALLGNKEIVLRLIKFESKFKTEKSFSQNIIKEYKPMIKNLDSLLEDETDTVIINNLNNLIDTTKKGLI